MSTRKAEWQKQIRPVLDRIAVVAPTGEDGERTTPGGLVVPDGSDLDGAQCCKGRVIAVGPDVEDKVKEGELIYFMSRGELQNMEHAGNKYKIVDLGDVHTIIDPVTIDRKSVV